MSSGQTYHKLSPLAIVPLKAPLTGVQINEKQLLGGKGNWNGGWKVNLDWDTEVLLFRGPAEPGADLSIQIWSQDGPWYLIWKMDTKFLSGLISDPRRDLDGIL